MARIGFRLFLLGFALHVSALETVSITKLLPTGQHSCATNCVYTLGFYSSDVGLALSCGSPYDNHCYCATEAASVSKANAWFASCATSRCAAGDVARDLTAMHSIYASYCMNAGYTQPGATDWYAAEAGSAPTPGQTTSSGPMETTTQLTIVTQTATPSSAIATQPQATVKATSTLWVDSKGSVVPAPLDMGSRSRQVALGIGLGVGILVTIAFASVGIWLGCRRRSKPKTPLPLELDYSSNQPMATPYHHTSQHGGIGPTTVTSSAPTPASGKEVSSRVYGLSRGLDQESNGQELSQSVPNIPPNVSNAAADLDKVSGAIIPEELAGQERNAILAESSGELSGQPRSAQSGELPAQGWAQPPSELAG